MSKSRKDSTGAEANLNDSEILSHSAASSAAALGRKKSNDEAIENPSGKTMVDITPAEVKLQTEHGGSDSKLRLNSVQKRKRTRKTLRPKRRPGVVSTDRNAVKIPSAPADNDKQYSEMVDVLKSSSSADISQPRQPKGKVIIGDDFSVQKTHDGHDQGKDSDLPSFTETSSKKMQKKDDDLSLKTETMHGFVVDQWCDLGPSRHEDGHSPLRPPQKTSDKLQIKESPGTFAKKSRLKKHFAAISATSENNQKPGDMQLDFNDGKDIQKSFKVGKDEKQASLPCQGISQSPDKFKEDVQSCMTNERTFNNVPPLPVPIYPLMSCPLPSAANSFNFHIQPFPLTLHAATQTQFQASTTSMTLITNTSGLALSQNVSSTGMTTGMGQPGVSYVYQGLSATRFAQGDSVSASCQDSRRHESPESFAQTATTMPSLAFELGKTLTTAPHPVALLPSSITSGFTDSSSTSRPPAVVGGFQYPNLVYQDNIFQPSSLQPGGMLLVPPHPYLFQQMPFMPVPSSLNYTGVSSSTETGTEGVENTVLKLLTDPHRSPQLKEVVSTSTKAHPAQEKIGTYTVPSKQHSRPTLKPKMTGAKDFIDPTRMKFGLDDEGSDDELLKMKEVNDSSDEDWQPKTKTRKSGSGRGGNGSEDGSYGGGGSSALDEGEGDSDISVMKIISKRRKRSTKEPVKCAVCDKLFQGEYHLRRHQMSHSDIRPHECQICQKRFKQKAHLIGHQTVHERAQRKAKDGADNQTTKSKYDNGSKCPGRPKKSYTEKDLSCRECGKSFKTVYRLKRHEQSHTDVRPFSCRICGKGFKQTGHRNEHEANHEKTKKQFLCNMCGVVFRCRSSFNNHMKSHGTEKLRLQQVQDTSGVQSSNDTKTESGEVSHTGYDCPYCTEKFATAQALNSHLETHVEVAQRRHVQPYSCDVCRRAFTYRHNLLKHKLIHKAPEKFAQFYKEKIDAHVASGKPSFKCFKCSKVFIRKETLAKHFKIHSGNKPYKCTVCFRDFTQNVHLKVHMRKHTGSRPFQCKECSKSFIDSTALAKHIEYEACNADNSLYHCKICDKRHFYLGSIKQHIRREHVVKEEEVQKFIIKSERPVKRRSSSERDKYACKVCHWSFSEKCNLVRHIKRKHFDLVELLQKDLNARKKEGDRGNADKANGTKESARSTSASSDKSKSTKRDPDSANDSDDRDVDDGSRKLLIDEGASAGSSCPNVRASDMSDVNLGTSGNHAVSLNARSKLFPSEGSSLNATNLGANSRILDDSDEENVLPSAEEEEGRDGLLEGFQKVKFACLDRHISFSCRHESFLSTDCRFSNESMDESGLYPEANHISKQQTDCTDPEGKHSIREESSSPTGINFLYNIGLIVSRKAKRSNDSDGKGKSDTPDSETSDEVFVSPCESPQGLDKESDSQDYGNAKQTELFGSQRGLSGKLHDSQAADAIEQSASTCTSPRHCDQTFRICNKMSAQNVQFVQNITGNKTDNGSKTCIVYELGETTKRDSLGGGYSRMVQDKHKHVIPQLGENETDKKSSTAKPFLDVKAGSLNHDDNIQPDQEDDDRDMLPSCELCTVSTTISSSFSPVSTKRPAQSEKTCVDETVAKCRMPQNMQSIYTNLCQTDSQNCNKSTDAVVVNITSQQITTSSSITDTFATAPCKCVPDADHTARAEEIPASSCGFSSSEPSYTDMVNPLVLQDTKTKTSNDAIEFTPSLASLSNEKEVNTSVISPEPGDSGAMTSCIGIQIVSQSSTPNEPTDKVISGVGVVRTHSGKPDIDKEGRVSNQIKGKNGEPTSTNIENVGNEQSDQTTKNSTTAARLDNDMPSSVLSNQVLSDLQVDCPQDDYEACPTESHLRHLGLLACKDAREIKSRSYPLEEKYTAFKPWLEEMIFSSRSKRTRVKEKSSTLAKDVLMANELKSASSQDSTTSPKAAPKRNNISCETRFQQENSHFKSVKLTRIAETPGNEPSIFKKRKRLRNRDKNKDQDSADTNKNPESRKIHVQLGTVPSAQSPNAGPLEEIQPHTEGPPDFQPSPTSLPSYKTLTSTTTRAKTSVQSPTSTVAVLSEDVRTPTVTTVSVAVSTSTDETTVKPEGVFGSPPSTPDSTMRGKHQFPCVVCSKVFTARHQLKRHEMTHTDNRPYNCETCGRSFRQKVHLSDHMKRHQGQRPFVCAGCGKRFVLKNEMNQHIKNHCKGTRENMTTGSSSSEKPIFTIALNELQDLQTLSLRSDPPSTCTKSTMTALPKLECHQEFMTVCGQSYKPGDIISNGTITLRVVESLADNPNQKRETSRALHALLPTKETTTDCQESLERKVDPSSPKRSSDRIEYGDGEAGNRQLEDSNLSPERKQRPEGRHVSVLATDTLTSSTSRPTLPLRPNHDSPKMLPFPTGICEPSLKLPKMD